MKTAPKFKLQITWPAMKLNLPNYKNLNHKLMMIRQKGNLHIEQQNFKVQHAQ